MITVKTEARKFYEIQVRIIDKWVVEGIYSDRTEAESWGDYRFADKRTMWQIVEISGKVLLPTEPTKTENGS